ncbi:MAG TPA: SDR family oxidoreductase [Amycolatopsis sp.]|jgi:7-alpha-hydroxysteroid dehydrogenase|nr:SDR family oxidoreductase [Amycolatopsis sp.]
MTDRVPTAHGGDLAGYAALVTGGGTGLGKACAARLAADGATVTICGRTEKRLAAAAEEIRKSTAGGDVHYVVADVTNEDDMRAAVAAAAEPTGGLDACVANAGGDAEYTQPLHLQDVKIYSSVLELNVVGTLLSIKHALPLLVASGRGSFVGMSSIAGHQTHPYFGAYTAGKAGVEALIRNAADEYGPTRTRFNAVRPGFITTEIMEQVPRDSAIYASYINQTPMRDVGAPEDVANLVRFLIGPESRWITGQVINVDGGNGLRGGPDFSSWIQGNLDEDMILARKPPIA